MPFSYGSAPTQGRNPAADLLAGATDAAGNPYFPKPGAAPGGPLVAAGDRGPPASRWGPMTTPGSAVEGPGGGSQRPALPPPPVMPTGGPLPVMPSAQPPGSGPSQQSVEQAALAGGGDASRTQDFISALRAVGAGQNNAEMNAGTPAPAATPQLLGAPAAWTGNAGTTSFAQQPGGTPTGQSVLQSLGGQPAAPGAPAAAAGFGGTIDNSKVNFNPPPGDAWEKQSATMPSPFGGGAQPANMMRPIGTTLPRPQPMSNMMAPAAQGQGQVAQQAPTRPMQPPQGAGGAPPARPPQGQPQGQGMGGMAPARPPGAAGLMQRPPNPAPPRPNIGAQGMPGASAMMSDERAKRGIRDGASSARSLLELIALDVGT